MPFAARPAIDSRIALSMLREGTTYATYGVTPGSGTPSTLNVISEDITGDRTTVRVALLKSSGLPGPLRSVGQGGTGKALNIHAAPSADLEALGEMALCELFTADLGITATTISFDSGGTIDDSASGFGSVVAGTWIRVSGSAANSGLWRVDSATAASLTVSGGTVTTETAGPSVTLAGQHLINGTTLISASIERNRTDFSSGGFQIYRGVAVNSMAIAWDPESLFTVNLQLNHAGPSAATDTTSMPAAAAAASFVDGIDSTNNLANFRVDGVVKAQIRGFDLTYSNNLTPVNVSANAAPLFQALGTRALTGNVRMVMLENDTYQDLVDAFTSHRISFDIVPDAAAYGFDYILELPSVKATRYADFPKGGGTEPTIMDVPWEADESGTIADRFFTWSKVPK